MKQVLLVFAGGGAGSVCRFLVGKLYPASLGMFPWTTLTANFLSCLVFGAVLMLGVEKINLSYSIKLLVITGFCGGFSTYSSFTAETIELFKQSQSGWALGNIFANFIFSVAGMYLGAWLMRLV
ncbi:MAG: fluoride efflux transporter CrcB [Bacteroidota bacterium]|jgi:CrcB protein